VLTDFRSGNTIAATAFEIVVSLHRLENRAGADQARYGLLTQPARNRLRKRATQRRRRLKLDARACREQNRIEPDHVVAAAGIRADQPRHGFECGNFFEASVAVCRRACNIRGVKFRTGGLAEGLGLARRRRARCRQRNSFGNGNATAGTCQPQEHNQEAHDADFGQDYGISGAETAAAAPYQNESIARPAAAANLDL
jgi:hypothetical protein